MEEDKRLDTDTLRRRHLSVAEAVDAWRLFPRLIVFGYAWLFIEVILWFMGLENPTTQHTAFVSTFVGASAAVFGLYTNSGRKWNGFTPWKNGKKNEPPVLPTQEGNETF